MRIIKHVSVKLRKMLCDGRSVPFAHLRYFLKGRDKVVVTDDGQSVEHVDGLDSTVEHR